MAVVLDLLAIRRHMYYQISPNGSRANDRSIAQQGRPHVSTLTCAGRTRRGIRGALVQCHPVKGCQNRHHLTIDIDLFRADERFGSSRRHLTVTLVIPVVLIIVRPVVLIIVRLVAILVVFRLSDDVGHDLLVAILIVILLYVDWFICLSGHRRVSIGALRNCIWSPSTSGDEDHE